MQGLRLTLGGAPLSPQVIVGVPGLYRPDVATPIGGEGELSLEDAQRFAADESIPLELVDLTEAEAAEARKLIVADLEAARRGVAAAAQMEPAGHEPARIEAETEAIRPRASRRKE